MSLQRVDVELAWPDAAPLLAAALRGSDDTADEMLARCRAGGAWMLASDQAFVVVEPVAHGAGGFDLLIWAAASRGGRGCIARHLTELESIAADMGARRLAFRTGRRGFARALPEHWRIRQYYWAMEL